MRRSKPDGEIIGTEKEQNDLLLHDRNRLIAGIEYWSHCMWEGMRATCPEKEKELQEFLHECRITPWYIPDSVDSQKHVSARCNVCRQVYGFHFPCKCGNHL